MSATDRAQRLLVTGGAGYIGSVVTAALLDAGHAVTVLDDLSTGYRDAVPDGAQFIEAGITDADPVLADGGFDAVLHFAAKSLVAESVAAPEKYWLNNVVGSLALVESMRRHGPHTIVFSSTAATYGEPEITPIAEDAPTRPTNPYGASKLAVDHILTSYAAAHDFAAVSLRYFNVAGALITGGRTLGERHDPETHLIPIALQAAAGRRPALSIHGVHYPTPDGSCIRDYIHVVDLADAHVRALGRARAGEHLICNLGSGGGYSVREVVQTVRRVTGRPTPAVEAPNRPGDPAVLIAANTRAQDELGWRPVHSLEQMVGDAWAGFVSGTAPVDG